MNTNKPILASRRVYTWLLGLYPKEHRVEYAPAMVQLFTDQCRSAHHQRGWSGVLALWGRTFVDIGKTALIEHLSSPQSKMGLLQATPGMPLPWKGVLLVLIPGLVVFISQIGQLTGKGWFFTTLSWAGYAFMVPVLLVWWRAKRFPVWGFIPLGLLLQNVLGLLLGSLFTVSDWISRSPLRTLLKPLADSVVGERRLLIPLVCAVLLALLIWGISRRQKYTRAIRLWLGVYVLILVGKLALDVFLALSNYLRFDKNTIWILFIKQVPNIFEQWAYDVYLPATFLLVILLGASLARRHGTLAILLPLGYLLPTIVYGAYNWNPNDPFLPLVSTMVFIYRLSVAIIAPLWIARSASQRWQVWAITIPVIIALAAQIMLPIVLRSPSTPPEYIIRPIVDGLTIVAGSALAITMYKSRLPDYPTEATTMTSSQEIARR